MEKPIFEIKCARCNLISYIVWEDAVYLAFENKSIDKMTPFYCPNCGHKLSIAEISAHRYRPEVIA